MSYRHLRELTQGTALESLLAFSTEAWFDSRNNGDLPRWRRALNGLPAIHPRRLDLVNAVSIGDAADGSPEQLAALQDNLRLLMPWRKGPFDLFGVHIDTEWHSDWKWDRMRGQISPLRGRTILDVGCGSGYHCFRMAGEGARLAIGVDPQLAYAMQFRVIKHYVPDVPVYVLPATLEQLPEEMQSFDSVFSMGVLYHRRSPIDHLLQLQGCLRAGGELILETLVVDGPEGYALTPIDRYCRMPNVWFIPSIATTTNWLRRCGYKNIRIIDVSVTCTEEQRTTDWMHFQSLIDSLNPEDHSMTVEGLPAPKRAIIVAEAP